MFQVVIVDLCMFVILYIYYFMSLLYDVDLRVYVSHTCMGPNHSNSVLIL